MGDLVKLVKPLAEPTSKATMLLDGEDTNSWLARLLNEAGASDPTWLAYTCACAIKYCWAILSATSGVMVMQKKCWPYFGDELLKALDNVDEKSGNYVERKEARPTLEPRNKNKSNPQEDTREDPGAPWAASARAKWPICRRWR